MVMTPGNDQHGVQLSHHLSPSHMEGKGSHYCFVESTRVQGKAMSKKPPKLKAGKMNGGRDKVCFIAVLMALLLQFITTPTKQ